MLNLFQHPLPFEEISSTKSLSALTCFVRMRSFLNDDVILKKGMLKQVQHDGKGLSKVRNKAPEPRSVAKASKRSEITSIHFIL